jgi:hypothetical protein
VRDLALFSPASWDLWRAIHLSTFASEFRRLIFPFNIPHVPRHKCLTMSVFHLCIDYPKCSVTVMAGHQTASHRCRISMSSPSLALLHGCSSSPTLCTLDCTPTHPQFKLLALPVAQSCPGQQITTALELRGIMETNLQVVIR